MFTLPSPWSAITNLLCGTLLLLSLVGILVLIGYRKSRARNEIKPYVVDQNNANIEQVLVLFFVAFLTFFTMKNAGIHWLTAGMISVLMCAYYLGFSWNHSTGITPKPKNTISSIVASAVIPVLLMLVGLPLVLGNILFWAIFPWAQRHFFEREKRSQNSST